MKTFKCNFYILFLLILPLIFGSRCLARVQVHIINRLPDGMPMTLHCQSHDNDLGQLRLTGGDEASWTFSVNFWGTTMFYCDTQWDNSSMTYRFVTYDASRDARRCQTECWWMISEEETLYGYNQESEYWELFPFTSA
ncbi:hypothetical protein H5410_058534 [Solanum commersonii]|uniref:S-protein homolog n=1 Tax=Solanum commersonii TaxID=4109 RepID=A0A9J5WTS8_SOLCO|nr:hypothetical protein H5410_058534 [Solanum commersonii]